MGILKRFLHIRDEEIKSDRSVRADFWFCEILFLAIFQGFVWESGQLQRLRVGHWKGVLKRFVEIRDKEVRIKLSICGDFWISQILILMFFRGLYGNWAFSRLKLWDVSWRHRDDVMFFFSFGPWAIFLSTQIFVFRQKFFFRFFAFINFFHKKTSFHGLLRTKFNVLLILLKFQCQFRGAALEN